MLAAKFASGNDSIAIWSDVYRLTKNRNEKKNQFLRWIKVIHSKEAEIAQKKFNRSESIQLPLMTMSII